jgi:predicted sulfurtransferase
MIVCPNIRRAHGFRAVISRSFITRTSLIQQHVLFSTPITNQDIAERRLQNARNRKLQLQESVQRVTERNLQLKRLLHGHAPPTEDLYQIKVTVCEELRVALKLSGREKRGRVFLEASNDGTSTLRGLRRELHAFFRALKKDTYILSAGFPEVDEEGRVTADALDTGSFWDVENDDDVVETFQKANQYFAEHPAMKRPAITIHVRRNPNAPPEPPIPAYLENMPDPELSENMTMLSFYSFPFHGIADPEEYAQTLRKLWKPFHALGRIYVAYEGINAQMSIPTNVLEQFIECCHNLPEEVGKYLENGINVDPIPLSREEFAVAASGSVPPFKNLHIRVRQQIVADGLGKTYDWRKAGYDMPPLEWHQALKEESERREKGESPAITILDCRNDYESDVGIFEGAEPLDTVSFRDSWDVIKQKLADKPKDAPIMMYCTGGIRCVKGENMV